MADASMPVALRRTPRKCSGPPSYTTMLTPSASSPIPPVTKDSSQPSATTRTPGKSKSRKRVRFSDPGPQITDHDQDDAVDAVSCSTGLTPMVRRSSLGITPSPKRRRHSAPITAQSNPESASNRNEIRLPSLRQILSDRLKRRIRRNGLSEEMNSIDSEKRQNERQRAELQRLRDSLAGKDAEIERLRDTTLIHDADRIVELERELETLRSELDSRSTVNANQSRCFDWTLSARDPFSDDYTEVDLDTGLEDEGFGDSTMADLVCSTPSRRQAARSGQVAGSFPTPPCTSPTIPATPCSVRRPGPPTAPTTPKSNVSVQASMPDPEREALEIELGSLRFELGKLTETLETHAALKARMSEKMLAGLAEGPSTSDGKSRDETCRESDIETHLDKVLQVLSDRTAAMMDLNTSLSSLGFPGNDAGEIVASLTGSLRTARLELEYLTPGEFSLPLTSHGAEVLDLVLTRLRDLARKDQEHEQAIDEYHALELSLRQQLGARIDAMDALQGKLKAGEEELRDRDGRISDLEVGIDRLKGAAEGYRRDIAELETLVQRMEAEALTVSDEAKKEGLEEGREEGRASEKRLQSELDAARAELGECNGALAEFESKLASVLEQTEQFETQIAEMGAQKTQEFRSLNRNHGRALALRDARVAELKGEIDSINAGLRRTHVTIQKLRVENAGLGRKVEEEKARAKEAVDAMKAELERVLEMSAGFLATPKRTRSRTRRGAEDKPAPSAAISSRRTTRSLSSAATEKQTGAVVTTEATTPSKGKKRRRYDSGFGFMDEEEDEVDMIF